MADSEALPAHRAGDTIFFQQSKGRYPVDIISLAVWVLIFIGQCLIASAIYRTANNTEAILKLLKDEIAKQSYKEWKNRSDQPAE